MSKIKDTITGEIYDGDWDYVKVEVEKIVETQQSYINNINDLLNNE